MTLLGRIFHTGCERETTIGASALGLVAGAAVGAGLTATVMVVVSLSSREWLGQGDLAWALGSLAVLWLLVLTFSFMIWLAGLFVVAPAGWWLLHVLGARCQQAAMLYGATATFAATLLLAGDNPMLLGGWLRDAPFYLSQNLVLAGIGAVVGWIAARVAYGPAKS